MGKSVIFALALAGCQIGGAKDAPAPAAPSQSGGMMGPEVEVTTLSPAASTGAEPQPGATPAAFTELQPRPEAKPETAPAPEGEATPPKPKTPGQLDCEKRGGRFVKLGRSSAMTCQMPTKDGGKQCRRESDCTGVCLARSGTCAPVVPLLGCQSILQNDGRQVQLCID